MDDLDLFGEPQDGRPSPLGLPPPGLRHFRSLCSAMRERVVGHDEVVERLALQGVRFLLGEHVPTILLTGPSGVGKTTVAVALAEALGTPHVIVPIESMAERNWTGVDLGDSLTPLFGSGGNARPPERACILLDELDKASVEDAVGAGRDYRLGKQNSLLALMGGQDMAFEVGGQTVAWSSRQVLVIATGAFRNRPASTRRDLLGLGLVPELVDRIGLILPLRPLPPHALRTLLASEMDGIARTFGALGHNLVVAEETIAYLATMLSRSDIGMSARSAQSVLVEAAEKQLLRMLRGDAPLGSTVRLEPDDLEIPRTGFAPRRDR